MLAPLTNQFGCGYCVRKGDLESCRRSMTYVMGQVPEAI